MMELLASFVATDSKFVAVPDPPLYAKKLLQRAAFVTLRDGTGDLLGYIAFYDDQPEAFISMVWIRPSDRGRGLVATMFAELFRRTAKDLRLSVHCDNPARLIYRRLGFAESDSSQSPTIGMRLTRRVAVMQPYLFPYLGYFHLLRASSHFVFYDDVNFVKGGWINRNRLIGSKEPLLFSVPLEAASQNRDIRDVGLAVTDKWVAKFSQTLRQQYARAPYVSEVGDLVMQIMSRRYDSISELAIASVVDVMRYLGVVMSWSISSERFAATKGMERASRLMAITRLCGCARYINLPGGRALYSPAKFAEDGIELQFIESRFLEYPQRREAFVPGLSIVDVMMWNSPAQIRESHLLSYTLS